MFTNPYAGLVIFIAVPALFVFGLLLIPLGIWLQRRRLRRDPSASVDWPVIDFRVPRVRAIAIAVTALTVVNAILILLAAHGSLHYMESPEFCGQTCHTPMHPQYTAWQNTTARRGRLRAVSHRRGRAGARALQAGRRPSARARHQRQLPAAHSGVTGRAAARARDLWHLPLAHARAW